MKYKLKLMDNGVLAFECIDGGIGSERPRPIRCSNRVSPINLLDALWLRGHLSYDIYYCDEIVVTQRYRELTSSDDFDASKLTLTINSELDVLTLCAFAWNAITGRGRRNSKGAESKYSRPTSKKAVQQSWLYQCGVEQQVA